MHRHRAFRPADLALAAAAVVALSGSAAAQDPKPAQPAPAPAPSPDAPKIAEFVGKDRMRLADGKVVLYYRVNHISAEILVKELELWKTPGATITATGVQFAAAPQTAVRAGEPAKPQPFVSQQTVIRIIETEENLPILERVLRMIDVPQPQVRVDVKVIELTWDDQTKLGFTAKVARPVGDTFFQSAEVKFPNSLDAINGTTAVFKNTDKYLTFDYVLQAAAQGIKTDLKSQPSVLASQGETAIVRAGDEEPVVQQNISGNTVQATTVFKPIGVRMEVQPLLIGRDYVRVRIAAEASRLSDFRVTATSSNQQVVNPVISTRNADTIVTVPNGETLIIGGLDQTTKRDVVTGIPLLMDIPLLGALFRSTTTRETKSELIFWITLTIETPEDARLVVPDTAKSDAAKPVTPLPETR